MRNAFRPLGTVSDREERFQTVRNACRFRFAASRAQLDLALDPVALTDAGQTTSAEPNRDLTVDLNLPEGATSL